MCDYCKECYEGMNYGKETKVSISFKILWVLLGVAVLAIVLVMSFGGVPAPKGQTSKEYSLDALKQKQQASQNPKTHPEQGS